MKRSEMVQVIQEYLDFHGIEAGEHAASWILKKVQDAGMLPPSYSRPEKRVGPCWEVDITVQVNEWEDEAHGNKNTCKYL